MDGPEEIENEKVLQFFSMQVHKVRSYKVLILTSTCWSNHFFI